MGIASRNSGIYAVTRGGGVDNSIIADPFVTTKAYSKGDLVINNGYLYKATDAIEAGEWDADKWENTNIANAGFVTNDSLEEVCTAEFHYLSKYESKIAYEEHGVYPVKLYYKKHVGIVIFGMAVHVTTSFTPTYASGDGVGDADWPAIGYIQLPESTSVTGTVWGAAAYPSASGDFTQYGLTKYNGNKIGVRVVQKKAIPSGYLWLYTCPIVVS